METVLTPIYFSTSNLGKLAQARLVMCQYGFEVNKLLGHSSEYSEPYGMEREAFLSAGLQEVVERAGSSSIVFIEDTTVRIHALSNETMEFPGQETKEWFARTNHDALLTEIERNGGDRTATVRSDIALHVPGLDRFVFFFGSQTGAVADEPAQADGNVAYPWLGRRDFSSWFIPSGGTRPLAAMSYEESRRFDYREHCLRQVAARLQEYQAVGQSSPSLFKKRKTREPGQMSLVSDLYLDDLIVIVGKIGAGKTTIGRYLSMVHNLPHFEGSTLVKQVAVRMNIDGQHGFDLADRLFATCGLDVVEREVVWPAFERGGGPIVYTGARTLEGLLYLRKKAQETGLRCIVWHVDAPEMTRHIRVIERVRDGDNVAGHRFDADSARDTEYGAAKYADVIADCHIRNTRGVGELLDAAARAAVAREGEFIQPAATYQRRAIRKALTTGALDILAKKYPDLVSQPDSRNDYWRLSRRGSVLQELVAMTPLEAARRSRRRHVSN
ncbi:non-canonical purine NTP pyrophosphatase [Amycolatopsis sp. NPDC051061]|uniref:non-canonical purine NTP pyrophosphatase n=1 Tax=Amycolatopsis sp. NPDC051061 TaxID=3155042 RepID=UPI0034396F6C